MDNGVTLGYMSEPTTGSTGTGARSTDGHSREGESFRARLQARREREILEALLTTFCVRGCFATSLDHVIGGVGIGKNSLYQHFSSREELFRAALEYGVHELLARCHRIWDENHGRGAGERLLAVVADLVSLSCSRSPLSPDGLARMSCGNRWATSGRSGRVVESAFVPLVRHWQSAGVFDAAADPVWIATVLLGLVTSPSLVPTHDGADESAETHASRIVALLVRAFAPPQCAPVLTPGDQP